MGTPEENKALAQRFLDALATGDVATAAECFDPGNYWSNAHAADLATTWERMKARRRNPGFSDVVQEQIAIVADGDRVVNHSRTTGTHTGEFLGIPRDRKAHHGRPRGDLAHRGRQDRRAVGWHVGIRSRHCIRRSGFSVRIPWEYGLSEKNRKVLDTLVGYSHEQGLIKKRPTLEHLFLNVDQGRKRGGEYRI